MRTTTFDDIDSLFDRMHRFAGIDEGEGWGDQVLGWNDHGGVRVDLTEHDDDLVVVADLPGFDREEIDLTVEGDRLRISATNEETETDESEQYLRRERRTDAVRRSIRLPVDVDADAASAAYTNGVLTITLPKQAEGDGHRIDVN